MKEIKLFTTKKLEEIKEHFNTKVIVKYKKRIKVLSNYSYIWVPNLMGIYEVYIHIFPSYCILLRWLWVVLVYRFPRPKT